MPTVHPKAAASYTVRITAAEHNQKQAGERATKAGGKPPPNLREIEEATLSVLTAPHGDEQQERTIEEEEINIGRDYPTFPRTLFRHVMVEVRKTRMSTRGRLRYMQQR